MKIKLFYIVNVEWSFLSHRLPLGLEGIRRNYDVTVVAVEEEKKANIIESYGMRFIPLPTSRGGTNIFKEIGTIFFLYKLYKKEKPDIIHHVAIKPVLYGSLAARFAKRKNVINAIAGMGSNFIGEDFKSTVMRICLRKAFKIALNIRTSSVIVQNKDDQAEMQQLAIFTEDQIELIQGSGIDINEYYYTSEDLEAPITVLLPSRILRDKGILEFYEAAVLLKDNYSEVKFIIAGKTDHQNRTGISKKQLDVWNTEGVIEWIGHQENMISIFRKSSIVVLPSYREGLPKALIEACSIGRPIVTTNVPGCKDVVEDQVNGLLVKVRDSKSLAAAIKKLIDNENLREYMGLAGRKKAEKYFSIEHVVKKTFNIYLKSM